MKNFFKKAFKSIAIDMGIVLVVIAGIAIFIFVAPDQALADSYTPLTTVPGLTAEGVSQEADLGTYISDLYNFSIAIGAALAVLMLVIAGFQYASTDNFGNKTAGRDRMTGALLGLGLLLTSFLLLSTINSDLIDTAVNIETAESELDLEGISVQTFEDFEEEESPDDRPGYYLDYSIIASGDIKTTGPFADDNSCTDFIENNADQIQVLTGCQFYKDNPNR